MNIGISLPLAMKCNGRRVSLLRVALRNIPGALAKISTLLANHNINILSSIIDAPLGKPEALMIAFIDYSKTKTPLREIASKIKDLDVVIEAKIIKPQLPGIIINDLAYPIKCLEHRCILVHVDGIRAILEYLYGKFGYAAKTLMYYIGYGSIKEVVRRIKKTTGLRGIPLLEACLKMFQAHGYGKFQVTPSKLKPIILVKAYELFECVPFKGKLEEPNSQLFRGVLAGMAEEVLRKEVEVIETKCIGKGDPYCLFAIKPHGM